MKINKKTLNKLSRDELIQLALLRDNDAKDYSKNIPRKNWSNNFFMFIFTLIGAFFSFVILLITGQLWILICIAVLLILAAKRFINL